MFAYEGADCSHDTAFYLQVVLAIGLKLFSVRINAKNVVITFV